MENIDANNPDAVTIFTCGEPSRNLTAADEIERLRTQFETVQPLIDCRVCDYYVAGYMPCTSIVVCRSGDSWTRTKTVQVWPNGQK